MHGYIDVHNHILPELDDGAQTLVEAIEMVRSAYQSGVSKIIATPHQNEFDHPSIGEINEALTILRLEIQHQQIDVEVYPGSELRIRQDLPQLLANGELLPLANSRYILFEFPFIGIPLFAADVVFHLRTQDWIPILAHPERIADIQEKPDRVKPFKNAGCLLQINTHSLTGELGRVCLTTAVKLLEQGLVDIIASDAHGSVRSYYNYSKALAVAAKIVGREAAEDLVIKNPARIFE